MKQIFFFILILFFHQKITGFTVILDPAGDRMHTGRIINGMYENALAFTLCQRIQQTIQSWSTRVILSRTATELIQPLQHAEFANKLPCDWFISLHCCQTKKTTIWLYYYLKSPTDIWVKQETLALVPYNQAHLNSLLQSQEYAILLYKSLKKISVDHDLIIEPARAFPCLPLVGILAPVLLIECGIGSDTNITQLSIILSQALKSIIQV